ncbi:MAG: nuclear transport factor 2 family protein [Tepidisphaera sp.]|jgi:ketosteroid isomerase-like protein
MKIRSMVLWGLAVVAVGGQVSCSSGKAAKAEEERLKALIVDFSAERRGVNTTLDAMHAAAAKADLGGYLGCFAPDLIFLGTDPKERWNSAEFAKFVKHYFDQGQGWAYALVPESRNVVIEQAGNTAWFDEMLMNEKYGLCRGSGVLRKLGGRWLVSQYNLSFPVPNEVADKVVQLNRTVR